MKTSQCRISGKTISPFISFGNQPIANNFLSDAEFNKEYFFPLEVGFCEESKMVQLINQPAPEMMFHENYAFFSGTSVAMTDHFKNFADEIISKYLPKENSFVVEIGSNDGIMLQNFAAKGIRHLGIEPSANVAEVARSKGINTICSFFSKEIASQIISEYGQADAYLAANVMCHIPTFHSVVEGISILLKKGGVAVFEDPYLGDVIEKTSYDQFYDEHVFIFSLASIQHVFNLHGMELVDAKPQTTHGGSMRYYLAHKGCYEPSASCEALLKKEEELGLNRIETFYKFRENCERSKQQFVEELLKLKNSGKRVVGYAATSKSTTVLNYCQVGVELIEFISDTTPIKQGKFSPGMHIPVVPYDKFKEKYPDVAVLFAWNHAKEIFAKETDFMSKGGKWLMFVPKVEIK